MLHQGLTMSHLRDPHVEGDNRAVYAQNLVRCVPGAPGYLGPAGVPLRHLGDALDPGLRASCVTSFSLKLQRKALGKRVALLAFILLMDRCGGCSFL
jgi:hypothetical protein